MGNPTTKDLLDGFTLRSVNELTTNEETSGEVGLALEDGGIELVSESARHDDTLVDGEDIGV